MQPSLEQPQQHLCIAGMRPTHVRQQFFLIVLLALPLTGMARAQTPTSVLEDPFVRERAGAGLTLLYDMQFEEATAHFEAISKRYRNHPVGPFLLALTLWWEILLDLSDTQHDEAFYVAMTRVIERSNEMLEQDRNNFDAMFFKGIALGFRGRLRSNRREWIRAASDGKRAMNYVLAVADVDSTNDDYVFGRGLYDYYAAVIPRRYPFVRPITSFLPKGDRARGLAALARSATRGYYVRTEAAYFLLQIYYVYESDFAKSIEYATMLRQRHPGNPFFHTIEGRVYARWEDWATSEYIFRDILQRYLDNQPGYNAAAAEQALYYLARAQMVFENYKAAARYLLQLKALSARLEDDTYFKVMGRLLQGMVHDALGQRVRAEDYYRQVLSMRAWGSSHTQAKRYLDASFGGSS